MDYLDYLTDYDYDALPPAVRSTIDRATYEERREIALLMQEPDGGLPASLQAAFLARTQDAEPVQKSKVRWLPWLAAAGWLLFLGVSSVLLFQEPETLLVEKTIVAPAAEPVRITVTDTIYETVTQVRYRTRYDTVYQEIASPAQLVYVRDTLYLPLTKPVLVKGSSNLSGKERVLDFLFSTE
jgi:hypothetical protein